VPEPVAANPNPNPNPAAAPAAKPAAAAPVNGAVRPAAETWASRTFSKPELKSHAILSRFQNTDALGDSYLALEKKLSDKNAHVRPGADATPEERAEFNKWLGVPESVEKYSLNLPDKIKEILPENSPINEKFIKAAFERFHAAGLTDEQASSVVQFFATQQAADIQALTDAQIQAVEALKGEWGHDFNHKLAVAGRAMDALCEGEIKIEGLAALLDEKNPDPFAQWFQNNPVVMRLFQMIGEASGEDPRVEGEHRAEEQIADVRGKIKELTKPGGPYFDANHADHKSTVERVKGLYEQLTGGAAG
jgi:hypothetical protein